MPPGSVQNLHMACVADGEALTFLFECRPGGCDRSFGVHVARLACFPAAVVADAEAFAAGLEGRRVVGPPDEAAGPERAPKRARRSAGPAERVLASMPPVGEMAVEAALRAFSEAAAAEGL